SSPPSLTGAWARPTCSRSSSRASWCPSRARERSSTSTTATCSIPRSGRASRPSWRRACRRTCSPTRRKLDSLDRHPLQARLEPGGDAYAAPGHAVVAGEEFDQRLVRPALHGRRRQPDLGATAVLAGEFGLARAGLHVKLERHSPAAATRSALSGNIST